jgi:hypothetical protein
VGFVFGGSRESKESKGDEDYDAAPEQDHGETPGEGDRDSRDEVVVLVVTEPHFRPEDHDEQYTPGAPHTAS